MKIYFSNSQKDLSISASSVKQLVTSLLKHLKIVCDEVSFHFVTTRRISQLHKDFFDDPTTTDCITFPIDFQEIDHFRVLGEVFVCPKTAIDYADRKNTDPYVETTLYVVHGILHLIGYDDIAPKDRTSMRKKERQCMKFLQENNLVLGKKKIV